MFNDDYGLTQAVLDGRKTMTRRIIEIDECVRFPIIRFRPLEKWEKKVVNPNYVFNGHVYAVYNELNLLYHLVKPRTRLVKLLPLRKAIRMLDMIPTIHLENAGLLGVIPDGKTRGL